ncbi:hypothetical protein [Commensalibacter sp. ESL0382]|uniref:hypothetical protein n=1 Tax=Commensalibacter sp. ESL0382 TaxID=2676445 RepID=UPI0012D8DE00|nr:hypothetical protein [Commensalibacter sp. ESL0382]MUG35049.1 hypothetical protein [Commensalibacter sp. ESL0382]
MNKIKWQGLLTQTEEITKNFFILPFAQMILEHDVFSHLGVMQEYNCRYGVKMDEKMDFVTLKDEKNQILIECKKLAMILI